MRKSRKDDRSRHDHFFLYGDWLLVSLLMDSFRDSLAGGLGGLACAVVGQPLDTVKVKQQTYPHVYPSTSQTLAKSLREEGGLRGLYAGCGAAVGSNMAENAVLFVCYERCLDLVRWVTGEQSRDGLSVTQQAFAGSLASVASSVAINPFERIKCKMQVQGQQKPQSIGTRLSHWSVAGGILQEEGVRGLFRGLTSTWAREVPGYFFFFGGYNASRRLLSSSDGQSDLSVWRLAVAGGLAGCCFWTSIFPTDVVKSRVQVNENISGSFWITMFQIVRNEGILALYRGLFPTLLRSFPANGALFVTYEFTKSILTPSNVYFTDH